MTSHRNYVLLFGIIIVVNIVGGNVLNELPGSDKDVCNVLCERLPTSFLINDVVNCVYVELRGIN